jgi:hypothetical protein
MLGNKGVLVPSASASPLFLRYKSLNAQIIIVGGFIMSKHTKEFNEYCKPEVLLVNEWAIKKGVLKSDLQQYMEICTYRMGLSAEKPAIVRAADEFVADMLEYNEDHAIELNRLEELFAGYIQMPVEKNYAFLALVMALYEAGYGAPASMFEFCNGTQLLGNVKYLGEIKKAEEESETAAPVDNGYIVVRCTHCMRYSEVKDRNIPLFMVPCKHCKGAVAIGEPRAIVPIECLDCGAKGMHTLLPHERYLPGFKGALCSNCGNRNTGELMDTSEQMVPTAQPVGEHPIGYQGTGEKKYSPGLTRQDIDGPRAKPKLSAKRCAHLTLDNIVRWMGHALRADLDTKPYGTKTLVYPSLMSFSAVMMKYPLIVALSSNRTVYSLAMSLSPAIRMNPGVFDNFLKVERYRTSHRNMRLTFDMYALGAFLRNTGGRCIDGPVKCPPRQKLPEPVYIQLDSHPDEAINVEKFTRWYSPEKEMTFLATLSETPGDIGKAIRRVDWTYQHARCILALPKNKAGLIEHGLYHLTESGAHNTIKEDMAKAERTGKTLKVIAKENKRSSYEMYIVDFIDWYNKKYKEELNNANQEKNSGSNTTGA